MNKNTKFTCQRCGKCCFAHFIAYVTDRDIERWNREKRNDILYIIEHEIPVWAGDHLVSAKDGRYLHDCPFLKWKGNVFSCTIYETRPRACSDYDPGSSELCPQFNKK